MIDGFIVAMLREFTKHCQKITLQLKNLGFLAESCRIGYKVGIIDVNAEKLTHQEALTRVGSFT